MASNELDTLVPIAFLTELEDVRHITFSEPIPEADQIDSRTLRVVHFHRDSSGLSAFWEAGDLRFLSLGTDSVHNVSRSASHGWNYGAYPYFHQGNLHLVGGYGFWRKHYDDIVFMKSRAEWERVGSSQGIVDEDPAIRDMFFRHSDGSIGCLKWAASSENPEVPGSIWSMPAGGGSWSQTHVIQPHSSASHIDQVYDLKNELIIGFRNGNLMVVNKRTWEGHAFTGHPAWEVLKNVPAATALAVFNDRVEAWQGNESVAALDLNGLDRTPDEAFSFATSVLDGDSTPERTDDDASVPWVWASFALLAAIPFAFVQGVRRAKKNIPAVAEDSTSNEASDAVSAVYAAILKWEDQHISIPEFDAFIEGADHLGPEGVRSRRAQLFREVNRLAQLELGQTLLQRQRSPNDSRTFRYLIKKPR